MSNDSDTVDQAEDVNVDPNVDADADAQATEPNDSPETEVEIQNPEFQQLEAGKSLPFNDSNRLNDIKIVVSAELGRTDVPIQDLLMLGPGSVLELERSIDSPIELVTQGVPLAKGEVVVVNGCFGIRITEVYKNVKPQAPE